MEILGVKYFSILNQYKSYSTLINCIFMHKLQLDMCRNMPEKVSNFFHSAQFCLSALIGRPSSFRPSVWPSCLTSASVCVTVQIIVAHKKILQSESDSQSLQDGSSTNSFPVMCVCICMWRVYIFGLAWPGLCWPVLAQHGLA